jgi:phosphomannomutase
MNNFPTYSLWWIVCLKDYYFQNKNHDYLLAQKDYLKGLVKQLSAYVDENGHTLYGFNFIDWPTHFEEGDPDEKKRLDEITGTHALTVYAIKCAKVLLEILNESQEDCDELLARLLKTEYKVEKYKQIYLEESKMGELNEFISVFFELAQKYLK